MSIKGEFSKQASAWSAYLSDCISNGKKQKVEEFLQDYPSAAYLPLEHGQSPLYFAYKCKKLEIFCLLLDNGASPDTDTLPVSKYARFMTRLARPLLARPDAFPIIERVVKNGDIDFLLPLIERGADTSSVWPELAPQRSRNSVRILIDHAPEHRARHLESVKRDLIESQYLEQFETELERENRAKVDMKLDREIYVRAPIKINALSKNKAFTLVELAIVITIIGLLIGGVLKGQEMINNAKVTATIAQISSYTSATETFRDKYDNFPGDMAHATSRLPGCTAGNYCLNGNGDSRVGRFNPSYSWTELQSQAGIITLPEVETTMYWKHLALADLITGVDPGADPENPVWGKTHPAGRFDGGFHQWNSNYGAQGQLFTGFVIQQRATMLGGYNTTGGERVGAMAPVHAAVIDRKMDDGLPDQGWVLSPDTYGECDNTTTTRQYNTTTAKKCNLTFRIF